MRVRGTGSASLYYFKKCSWLCFTFSILENFKNKLIKFHNVVSCARKSQAAPDQGNMAF